MADEEDAIVNPEEPEEEKVAETSASKESAEMAETALIEAGETRSTPFGLVRSREISKEMEESYLDYAMSVIVSRALPDVRDGLKPVHRRVLYAMWDTGLKSSVKYRKSAAVVGEVMKSYHPHGDSAIYDTLVRMAQLFSMRYPLVDGQGNFGSVDGDSAAAMRYTEARMASIAEELLMDIEKETVDFIPNFDGMTTEPTVLPSKLPNLLLNGALGIAVGMATNIPPHNLTELCDALINLSDNPELTVDELMAWVKGPDFPTGGLIFNTEDIRTAYTTGKGRIVMRGVAEILEQPRGYQILISALPYQVNKSDLVTKIADLVKDKKIEGISDLRDESDRDASIRIVIDLKQSAFPKKILNQLYSMTVLESAFHVNMLALVDGIQPRVLTLKQVLEEHLKHRAVVIRRRTTFELNRAKDRAHILEGLKIALDHIDAVIDTIRKSANRDEARVNLVKQFKLTEVQANAILDMRLSALAALERQRVDDELKEKMLLIADLEAILASGERIRSIIKEELVRVRDTYGDERRTQVIPQGVTGFKAEDLIPNEQVIVTVTTGGYIKRVQVATYRSQNRGGKGIVGMGTKEEDAVEHLISTWTHNDILFFSDRGRLFTAKVYDLPSASRTAKGQAMPNIIQISPEEKITTILTLDKTGRDANTYFFMGTEKGVVKKTRLDAYANVRKTGLIAIKLRENDTLRWVAMTSGENRVMMVSHAGQAILFAETDVRPMGRSASGVMGMRLRSGDKVMAMTVIPKKLVELVEEEGSKKRGRKPEGPMLLTVVENGFGKRTAIDEFRGQRRGGIGVRAAKTTAKTGKVVAAIVTIGDLGDLIIISKAGVVIRMPLKSAKKLGRDAQGVTLMRLKGLKDRVVSVTVIIKSDDNDDDVPPPSTGTGVVGAPDTGTDLPPATADRPGELPPDDDELDDDDGATDKSDEEADEETPDEEQVVAAESQAATTVEKPAKPVKKPRIKKTPTPEVVNAPATETEGEELPETIAEDDATTPRLPRVVTTDPDEPNYWGTGGLWK
ncbi:MAG: DNA gyrase subunit A [Patescibacteria group bacterium]